MPVQFRRIGSLLCVVVMALLTACGGSTRNCADRSGEYAGARNLPPLKIPAELKEPDRSGALPIPDVKAAANRADRTTCIDDPPSYFRSAGTVARSPEEVIASWAQAWAAREADAVLELYSASFVAPTDSAGNAAWLEQRREQVAAGPLPDSMIEKLQIQPDGQDRRIATFIQRFGVNSLGKELILVRESGSWRIVEEKVIEVK